MENPLKKLELTVSWTGTNFSYTLIYYGRWQQ